MKEFLLKALIVILIVGFIIFYIKIANFTPKNKEDILLRKIDSLELKIDSLKYKKDSVRTVIDSIHIKIITNEKHYQERINTIITQPDSFSESFSRQYLSDYAAANGYNILRTSETE